MPSDKQQIEHYLNFRKLPSFLFSCRSWGSFLPAGLCSEQSTASTGLAEIRGLIEDNVGDGEIGVLINLLGETNEHQKLLTKKEQLKVFSLIAEALEERTIEFFPRIVQVLQKKIKESCNISELFHPIGDALGAVVEHSLKNVALNQSLNIVDYAFNVFINALIKDGT